MITEDICKALYALPGGVVTPRRKTIVVPAVAAAVGVVLLIVNLLAIDDSDGITAMTLISIGVLLLLYGVITSIIRLVTKRTSPYDEQAKCLKCIRIDSITLQTVLRIAVGFVTPTPSLHLLLTNVLARATDIIL